MTNIVIAFTIMNAATNQTNLSIVNARFVDTNGIPHSVYFTNRIDTTNMPVSYSTDLPNFFRYVKIYQPKQKK